MPPNKSSTPPLTGVAGALAPRHHHLPHQAQRAAAGQEHGGPQQQVACSGGRRRRIQVTSELVARELAWHSMQCAQRVYIGGAEEQCTALERLASPVTEPLGSSAR